MSQPIDQQTIDRRFQQAVEAAKEEIRNGLTLSEYLRRTGDEAIDEWASLLAEFGSQNQ
jgi:type II secretory pathway component PulF